MKNGKKSSIIKVQDLDISVQSINQTDYNSLTDIARYKDSERSNYIIQNWIRNKSTLEFLGLWEQLN